MKVSYRGCLIKKNQRNIYGGVIIIDLQKKVSNIVVNGKKIF